MLDVDIGIDSMYKLSGTQKHEKLTNGFGASLHRKSISTHPYLHARQMQMHHAICLARLAYSIHDVHNTIRSVDNSNDFNKAITRPLGTSP